MKKPSSLVPLAAGLVLAFARSALAATHYVDSNSLNSTPPYTNWATAATNIQDAVDAAIAGDEIAVTNGVYATGGNGWNRVAVGKPLNVRSVNGPQFTTIAGGGTNRCAYLTNNASLSGFTLTNGSGGVWCESASAVISNCVLTGNNASFGGGAYGGTLNNCTLSNNIAGNWIGGAGAGGGAAYSTLNNCTLTGNSAPGVPSWICFPPSPACRGLGGGAYTCILNYCTLGGNSADDGGGVYGSVLKNCTLTGNSSGGAFGSSLTNCIAYFNTGSNYDSSCTLNYCCTTPLPTNGVGNISTDPLLASASHLSALSPCIGKGYYATAGGVDIDGEPWGNPPSMGCDEYHAGSVTGPLSAAINASLTNVGVGYGVALTGRIEGRTDLSVWDFGDGALEINEPYTAHSWAMPGDYLVSLWAFNDTYPGGISATLAVHVAGPHYVASGNANPVAPYTSWSSAATNIQDAINAAVEPGAHVLVTNGTYAPIAVYRAFSIRSVNGAQFTFIDGGHSNRCALLSSDTSLSGFTLTNGYVDGGGVYGGAAYGGGAYGATLNNCTLIGNSVSSYYRAGGGGAYGCTLNNCILTDNSSSSSVDRGDGGGASECLLNSCRLTGNSASSAGGGAADSILNDCTLTGNSAKGGGGTYSSTLSRCTLTSNSVTGYNAAGGGTLQCTLKNCVVSANSASGLYGGDGGGAAYCVLSNCTLTSNSAASAGGGTYGPGTLNNCIVYFNTAPTGPNYASYDYTTFNYCCTAPQPTNGFGNITNAPLFVDGNGWGNLRLQSNSPCINSGNNRFAPAGPDLDGNPRIVGGTVDIGAYEFQSPTSIISYAWLQQYGLPTDGSADFADPDGDGMNNWQEWVCGTNPTNALSALRLLTPVVAGNYVTVRWQSVAGVDYFLELSTNLGAAFTPLVVPGSIPGQPGTTTYTDTIGVGPKFYRVGVSRQ